MAEITLTGALAVVGGVFLSLLLVGVLTVYFGDFLVALMLLSAVAGIAVLIKKIKEPGD